MTRRERSSIMKKLSSDNFTRLLRWAVPALFAAFFIWLAAQIPYAHDDWDWGISLGMQQLIYATVNSRYAGNLLEVILTRSEAAKCLIMGLTFLALPLAAVWVTPGADNTDEKAHIALCCLSLVLFLATGTDMWRETNGWVAGFANYSFSALILAVFIRQAQRTLSAEGTESPGRLAAPALIFVTVFVLQLYLENLTLYVAAAALALLIAARHSRSGRIRVWCALVAALTGTAVMFSSNIYKSLLSSGYAVDEYRQLTFRADTGLFGVAASLVRKLAADIVPPLYLGSSVHCLILLFVLFMLTMHGKRPLSKRARTVFTVCDALLAIPFVLELFSFSSRIDALHHRLAVAYAFLVSAAFFAVTAAQLICLLDGRARGWALAFWVSAPLVVLPMAAVNTVGPRTFYTPLFFISLVILTVSAALISAAPVKLRRVLAGLSAAALAALVLRFSVVYGAIGRVKAERQQLISAALDAGADEVVLPRFPYAGYLHGATPVGEEKLMYFKEFYGIPQDVDVLFD